MRSLLVIPAITLCLNLSTPSGFAGDLSGRIVITKQLSKRRVTLPAYQLRGASPAAIQEPGSTSNAGEVVVFLEGQLGQPDKPVRVELQQTGQRFEPQLLVIPVGSTVSFPNADPIFHNVFSLSVTKKFDLGYYPAGQTRIVKFDEPGVVQVYCHLHPNMYAAIVVAPNRWYTQPTGDGAFSFHDVPPGAYRLVTWHMNAGFFRRDVRVQATGGADIVVNIPVRDGERSR